MFSSPSSLASPSIWLLCAVCYVVWYSCDGVKNWYRLRHIPSPSIIATFSYLWIARVTYSGKQYWIHRDLHKKHGPLVRIGPNEILTDDPEILKRISSIQSTYHRSPWYLTGRFNPYHDNLLTILEPKAHKKAKAKSMAAYNGRETPGVERGIDEQVEKLIAILRERYSATTPGQSAPLLNLGSMSCYFTMDVITRLAFGEAIGDLDDEKDHHDFLGSIQRMWPLLSTMADVPWIRRFVFSAPVLKLVGPQRFKNTGFGALMAVAEHYVNKRFDSNEKQDGDMLESLIKHGFTKTECEVEGLLMLLAGTESSACAIRATLVHLITSPLAYARLKEEISTAIEKNMVSYPISFEHAKELPYLHAVVYEGLRMRPPLLGMFPKVVPAPGDTFHGKFIPEGTAICMNLSSLLHSTELFGPDADIFRPERFLELEDAKRREMERSVEMIFGYGQWMCAGKAISFMELHKVIFELLRAFDIQLANPLKPCDTNSYGVFIESNLQVRVSRA